MKLFFYPELTPKGDVASQIKEKAAKICERRRERGDALKKYSEEILPQISKFDKELDKLKQSLAVCSSPDKLTGIIEDFKDQIKSLDSSLKELVQRFKYAKIRVLSFGYKSQGKSLFTQLYTGLDSALVAVKDDNTDDDQTGATNIIKHNSAYKPTAPKITVNFRSENDILTLVNRPLELLSEIADNERIPKKFENYGDFKAFVNSDKKKEAYTYIETLQGNIDNFLEIKNLLLGFFNPKSNFDHVGGSPLNIMKSDLPMYNDMDMSMEKGHTQKYLSVQSIVIQVDLGRNGMLENFEICDTKGLSFGAGGELIEDELVNEINHSDAAFSISLIKPGGKADGFPKKVNSLAYEKPCPRIHSINDRHFHIVNVQSNVAASTLKLYIDAMNSINAASQMYIGALKDGILNIPGNGSVSQCNVNAKEFANNALLKMMGAIVDSTEARDKELISECMTGIANINKCISDIQKYCREVEIPPLEKLEDIIKNNIQSKREQLLEELSTYGRKEKIITIAESKSQSLSSSSQSPSERYKFDGEGYGDDGDSVPSQSTYLKSGVIATEYLMDTKKFHTEIDHYNKLKTTKGSTTIYSAFTGDNDLNVSKKDISQELELAISKVISDILEEDGNTKRSNLSKDLKRQVRYEHGFPVGDEDHIGCILDEIIYHFNKKIGDNIEASRESNQQSVMEDLSSQYKIVWDALHIKECVGIEPDFEKIRNADTATSAKPGFGLFYNVANGVDVNYKRRDALRISSFSFIKEYMSLASSLPPSSKGISVVESKVVCNSLHNLLFKSEFLARIVGEIEVRTGEEKGEIPVYRNLIGLLEVLKPTEFPNMIYTMYEPRIHTKDGIKELINWEFLPKDYDKKCENTQKWQTFKQCREEWNKVSQLEIFKV